MPINNVALAVGTTPTLVVNEAGATVTKSSSAVAPGPVELDNSTGTQIVYWGGPNVTTANGGVIAIGAKEMPIVYPGDDLYVVAGSACTIRVIAGRQ